jgi:hypothetical protein
VLTHDGDVLLLERALGNALLAEMAHGGRFRLAPHAPPPTIETTTPTRDDGGAQLIFAFVAKHALKAPTPDV